MCLVDEMSGNFKFTCTIYILNWWDVCVCVCMCVCVCVCVCVLDETSCGAYVQLTIYQEIYKKPVDETTQKNSVDETLLRFYKPSWWDIHPYTCTHCKHIHYNSQLVVTFETDTSSWRNIWKMTKPSWAGQHNRKTQLTRLLRFY